MVMAISQGRINSSTSVMPRQDFNTESQAQTGVSAIVSAGISAGVASGVSVVVLATVLAGVLAGVSAGVAAGAFGFRRCRQKSQAVRPIRVARATPGTMGNLTRMPNPAAAQPHITVRVGGGGKSVSRAAR